MMRKFEEWAMIALFCVTVVAGAVVGAALRSGMSGVRTVDTVYVASTAAR